MEETRIHQNRWLILAVMCISLFIISIDNHCLEPGHALDFCQSGASMSSLLCCRGLHVVMAAMLITTGTISDRYGRKRVLLAG